MRGRPRVWFSFRSPYSWLALERARASRPDLFELIELVPYWEPDPAMSSLLEERGARLPYVPMTRAKLRYILMDTRRLAREDGHALTWPVDREPHWEVSHLAWLAADQHGHRRLLYDAICRARWLEGRDISRPEVVARVADAIGLDGDGLAAAHLDPAIQEQGAEALYDAWMNDVFGVPYFRIGRHRFWGVDRVHGFLDALAGSPAPPPAVPEEALEHSPIDRDTVGGCG